MKGYKIRLYPTKEQEELIWKHFGACRYIWNYMLEMQKNRFKDGLIFKFRDTGKNLSTYNDEQINKYMGTYIDNVKAKLNGGGSSEVPSNPEPSVPSPVANNNISNEVPVSASAGFADIFVLTVIVLVYAVIIVNLIIRLK